MALGVSKRPYLQRSITIVIQGEVLKLDLLVNQHEIKRKIQSIIVITYQFLKKWAPIITNVPCSSLRSPFCTGPAW